VNLRILEIAPGLTQIKLPLPFELREVNVHLLRTPHDGLVLFDTGYHAADCFDTLSASLAELGVAWGDIGIVALTHMHPDHSGNAHRIQQLSGGARLAMRADEAELLNAISAAGSPPWFEEMLELAGTPEDLRIAVYQAFKTLREESRQLRIDIEYEAEFAGFEVIHTPGHSPGHVCFYGRAAELFLSGDHMLPGITPNIGWLPGRDMLGEYLDSLRKVDPLPVRTVVPSHGKPFEDHQGWLKATAEHHAERCVQIQEIAAERPVTAHGIVGEVWKRKLAPFHYQFAVSEILAHLVYMAGRDEIRRVDEGWRYDR
jgi:glyoxylase-like metal-dependent hydrolase (beta-lactamase superfamily II)